MARSTLLQMQAALKSRTLDKTKPPMAVVLFLDADGSVALARTYARRYSPTSSMLHDFAMSSELNSLARRSFEPQTEVRIRLPMTGHGKGFKKKFYECAKIGKGT